MIDTSLLVGREIYVFCETKEQATELLSAMEDEGYHWRSGTPLMEDIMWPGPGDKLAYHFFPDNETSRYVTSRGYESFLKDEYISANYPNAERTHFNSVCCDGQEADDSLSEDEFFSILNEFC